ncbi:hypothetical protein AC1031_019496 [Aphanomyces cochlioides]|nr:hypothetical protein AC1031_019496 [Aphanomyces cochlioides]
MGVEGSFEVFAAGELENEYEKRGGKGDLSLWKALEKGYNAVVNQLIQPPRKRYTLAELGPVEYVLPRHSQQIQVTRRDFVVQTPTHDIHGSLWSVSTTEAASTPCLVYLHSNMGCRLSVLEMRDRALAAGCNIAAFDFGGFGLSTGEFVTGGLREAEDIHHVLHHLHTELGMHNFFLWGHSLGAAAALLYMEAHKNLPIIAAVLDSPYTTFSDMSENIVQTVKANGIPAPAALLHMGMNLVTKSVESRAGFQITQVNPLASSAACKTPALFCSGKNDMYVKRQVAAQFMDTYGGPCTQFGFDGDHYGKRPREMIGFGLDFLMAAWQDDNNDDRSITRG